MRFSDKQDAFFILEIVSGEILYISAFEVQSDNYKMSKSKAS